MCLGVRDNGAQPSLEGSQFTQTTWVCVSASPWLSFGLCVSGGREEQTRTRNTHPHPGPVLFAGHPGAGGGRYWRFVSGVSSRPGRGSVGACAAS